MTISRTNIITALNAELIRSESTTPSDNMLRRIRAGLRWLSSQGRWKCLATSKLDYTTSSGLTAIDWPTNFRILDRIVVNDGTYDQRPLKEITFEEWLKRREDETIADYDEPINYAERGEKFYLDPLPDSNSGSNYTIKVWYWRFHPDQETILFGDAFEEAVNCAVIAEYLDGKGIHAKAQYYRNLAMLQVNYLRSEHEDKIERKVKYRDL